MLRNVLIVGSDGIILFEKGFVNEASEELVKRISNVITGVLHSSAHKIGCPPSYLEFENLVISIVSDPTFGYTAVLLYDPDDGEVFGKLLATQIITAFAEEYGGHLDDGYQEPERFEQFNIIISDTIRESVNLVLEHLQEQKGINVALLITGDQMVPARMNVDKLGIFANLDSVVSDAQDIMSNVKDAPLSVSFNGKEYRLVIRKIAQSTLVVQCESKIRSQITQESIEFSCTLLDRILTLISSLQDAWR